MAYSGRYKVKNLKKYKGDPDKVTYRSHWEKLCFMWCENNTKVKQWSSEETVVPYRWDVDKKMHRYFVDLKITFENGNTILVEIKPEKAAGMDKISGSCSHSAYKGSSGEQTSFYYGL